MQKTTTSALFFFFCVAIFSCQDSNETKSIVPTQTIKDYTPVLSNGRYLFSDESSYYSFLKTINLRELQELNTKNNFISTHNLDENLLSVLPEEVQLLLNKNGELIIANRTLRYDPNGNVFSIAIDGEKTSPEKIGSYMVDNLDDKNIANKSRVTLGSNGVDARHQYEFIQRTPVVGTRKYVHEIRTFTQCNRIGSGAGYSCYSTADLLIKMEWLGRRGRWKPAGENRNINFNINGYAKLLGSPFYFNNPFNTSESTIYNSNLRINLGSFAWAQSGTAPLSWEVVLNGFISQQIFEDASSYWNNSGYPLW